MTDPPSETCVTCGAGPVEKILFPVAVHFKGSGFYSTDYGRGGRKSSATDGDRAADKPAADKAPGDKDKGSGEKKASPEPNS